MQLGASEKRVRELSSDLKKVEDNFAEAILAHDEVASEKVRLDLELADLKNCVLNVHSQTFKQAIRQAVLFYGIPKDNELDENKDIYNGQLMPIEDIPSRVAPEYTVVLDDGSSGEERTP